MNNHLTDKQQKIFNSSEANLRGSTVNKNYSFETFLIVFGPIVIFLTLMFAFAFFIVDLINN